VEASLSGLSDGLAQLRSRIAQMTATLSAQHDVEQRAAKAKALDDCVPIIDRAYADAKIAVEKFAAALHGSSDAVPEAEALANWTAEFLKPIGLEMARIRSLHADRARELCASPPPPRPPAPLPQPALQMQPHRIHDRPDQTFVDWRP
jgi:hypothetical protein